MTTLSEPERLVHDALREADPTGLQSDSEHAYAARNLVAALRPLLAAETDANANRLVQVARAMGMVGPETVPFGSGFEGMVMAARQGREAVEAMEQRTGAVESGDDLGKLIQEALDLVIATKTTVLSYSPTDVVASTDLDEAKRKLLRARTLAAKAGKREIVTGEQARELPKGSRVVLVGSDNLPTIGAFVVESTHVSWDGNRFLVLHRAPAPAPKVGDVVRTEAELDRLPERSVLRSQVGAKNILERDVDGVWRNTKGDHIGLGIITTSWLPARVLDLGDAS